MENHANTGGWTILGTIVGVVAASHWTYQAATAVLTAVVTYAAVHFTKMLLEKYAPIKKNDK